MQKYIGQIAISPGWVAHVLVDTNRACYHVVAPNGAVTVIDAQMVMGGFDPFTVRLRDFLHTKGYARDPNYIPPQHPDCLVRIVL